MLKSIHRPVTLKKFDGKTIAVDAYGWLHRGTITCVMELATGKATRKYVPEGEKIVCKYADYDTDSWTFLCTAFACSNILV